MEIEFESIGIAWQICRNGELENFFSSTENRKSVVEKVSFFRLGKLDKKTEVPKSLYIKEISKSTFFIFPDLEEAQKRLYIRHI